MVLLKSALTMSSLLSIHSMIRLFRQSVLLKATNAWSGETAFYLLMGQSSHFTSALACMVMHGLTRMGSTQLTVRCVLNLIMVSASFSKLLFSLLSCHIT